MLLLTMIVLLFVLALLGMEIAWAIGVAALAYLVLSQATGEGTPFVLFSQQMTVGIDTFAYLAVPLFVFAGELMSVTGVTQRLVRTASAMVGHLHGGLANVGVTANFVMSGISGSALADAAATGAVLIPEMSKKGYPPTFSAAVVASAATVGPVIPPSVMFVILGAIVNISVGRLFLGGVIPGLLMSAAMFTLTYYLARRRRFPREPMVTGSERWRSLAQGVLPMAAPIFVIGSIVLGVATPTEAAAIAVVYTIALGVLVYRSFTFRALIECAASTALTSAIVMLTVGTSQMFAWIAVQERLGEMLINAILVITSNLWIVLLMVNALLLLLGMFMEPLPVMLVLAPVLFPLLQGLGVDPIHFGVIMVLNLMIGMITPPIGLNLFIVSAIGRVGMMEVAYETIPYIFVLIGVLLLITYVPVLTLWLPNLLFGGSG